jgi:uncharacterized ferritin-like protein (DUF455 family)
MLAACITASGDALLAFESASLIEENDPIATGVVSICLREELQHCTVTRLWHCRLLENPSNRYQHVAKFVDLDRNN